MPSPKRQVYRSGSVPLFDAFENITWPVGEQKRKGLAVNAATGAGKICIKVSFTRVLAQPLLFVTTRLIL